MYVAPLFVEKLKNIDVMPLTVSSQAPAVWRPVQREVGVRKILTFVPCYVQYAVQEVPEWKL